MSKPKIILIGAGGHAQACIDVIEQHDKYEIAGLVSLAREIHTQHLGYPVIAEDSNLSELAKKYQFALIAVGQIQTPDHRMRLYDLAAELGFQLPTIIAPSAYVSNHATIGSGTIVMHGAIVNAGARVGMNCIINTHSLVEHGATVEDHCHISTGAILNGEVKIGTGSFVGSGSIIKERVTLGQRCVVGMGVYVRQNEADQARLLGICK
jgi:sugar O-acyltransferase (sialic acid O-acetyltransferase NeuD family)